MTDTTNITDNFQIKSGVNEPVLSNADRPWLFQKGQSGNPLGRPKGHKNKITKILEDISDNDLMEIKKTLIDRAKFRVDYLSLLLKYTIPKPKSENISLIEDSDEVTEIKLNNTEDLKQAGEMIIKNMIIGKISPSEASQMMNLIEKYREVINV